MLHSSLMAATLIAAAGPSTAMSVTETGEFTRQARQERQVRGEQRRVRPREIRQGAQARLEYQDDEVVGRRKRDKHRGDSIQDHLADED